MSIINKYKYSKQHHCQAHHRPASSVSVPVSLKRVFECVCPTVWLSIQARNMYPKTVPFNPLANKIYICSLQSLFDDIECLTAGSHSPTLKLAWKKKRSIRISVTCRFTGSTPSGKPNVRHSPGFRFRNLSGHSVAGKLSPKADLN